MKATRNTYGEAAKQYAEILLEHGVPYDEILAEPSLQSVRREQLRLWKSRLKKDATPSAEIATKTAVATQDATAATEMQRGEATAETPAQPLENMAERAVLITFVKNAALNFHPADALYYLGVSIACYGIIATFQGIGVAVSSVIFSVAVLALQGVKSANSLVERLPYAAAFLLVEIVTAISHIAWANASLWKNVAALPFDIYLFEGWSADAGRMKTYWMGQTAWPFYSACGVAVVFFLTGVFVFFISLQSRKKQLLNDIQL